MYRFAKFASCLTPATLLALMVSSQPATAGCGKVEAAEKAPTKYYVYATSCRRSGYSLQSKCTDLQKAQEAAEKARKEFTSVIVSTSTFKSPWCYGASRYEVYRNTGKTWDLCGSTNLDWMADAISEAAAKGKASVVVVAMP